MNGASDGLYDGTFPEGWKGVIKEVQTIKLDILAKTHPF
jgi:hypothetical protein